MITNCNNIKWIVNLQHIVKKVENSVQSSPYACKLLNLYLLKYSLILTKINY